MVISKYGSVKVDEHVSTSQLSVSKRRDGSSNLYQLDGPEVLGSHLEVQCCCNSAMLQCGARGGEAGLQLIAIIAKSLTSQWRESVNNISSIQTDDGCMYLFVVIDADFLFLL